MVLEKVIHYIERYIPEHLYTFFSRQEIFTKDVLEYCIEEKINSLLEQKVYTISLKQFIENLSETYKKSFDVLIKNIEKYIKPIDFIEQNKEENSFSVDYASKNISLPLLLRLNKDHIKKICQYQVENNLITLDENMLNLFISFTDVRDKKLLKEKLLYILHECTVESYFLMEGLKEKFNNQFFVFFEASHLFDTDEIDKLIEIFKPFSEISIFNAKSSNLSSIEELPKNYREMYLHYYFKTLRYDENCKIEDINLSDNFENKNYAHTVLTNLAKNLILKVIKNPMLRIQSYIDKNLKYLKYKIDNEKTLEFYKIFFLMQKFIILYQEQNHNDSNASTFIFIERINLFAQKEILKYFCSIYSKKVIRDTKEFLIPCDTKISISPLITGYKNHIKEQIQDIIINKKYLKKNAYFLQSKYLKNFLFQYCEHFF